jgi:hypothetical protein
VLLNKVGFIPHPGKGCRDTGGEVIFADASPPPTEGLVPVVGPQEQGIGWPV